MDSKLAGAIVFDVKRRGLAKDRLVVNDGESVWTVTVERGGLTKFANDSGIRISAGPPGSPCACCGGSGRG